MLQPQPNNTPTATTCHITVMGWWAEVTAEEQLKRGGDRSCTRSQPIAPFVQLTQQSPSNKSAESAQARRSTYSPTNLFFKQQQHTSTRPKQRPPCLMKLKMESTNAQRQFCLPHRSCLQLRTRQKARKGTAASAGRCRVSWQHTVHPAHIARTSPLPKPVRERRESVPQRACSRLILTLNPPTHQGCASKPLPYTHLTHIKPSMRPSAW